MDQPIISHEIANTWLNLELPQGCSSQLSLSNIREVVSLSVQHYTPDIVYASKEPRSDEEFVL